MTKSCSEGNFLDHLGLLGDGILEQTISIIFFDAEKLSSDVV